MRESRFIRENHGVRIREAETYRAAGLWRPSIQPAWRIGRTMIGCEGKTEYLVGLPNCLTL